MNFSIRNIAAVFFVPLLAFTSFSITHDVADRTTKTKLTLYDSIVRMDSIWEDAYDNCKLDVMDELISEDIEFFHDQGGYTTSKQQLMDAVKQNICGKVTRELKKGSIEVHAIPGYGAVEIGMHGFHNKAEPNSAVDFSKFIHVWKKENDRWRITRVISLH